METACNIGPSQQRRRLWLGLPLAVIGGVGSFLTAHWWAPVVAMYGFLGVFQARAGTCVLLAARGARNMDTGTRLLQDPEQVAYFRRRSRGIYARTALATLALIVTSRVWLFFSRG